MVKAFIVLAEGHEGSDELVEEIQAHVRERLSAYAYPRRIEFVDDLPKTLTGKIRRIELRQKEIGIGAVSTSERAPGRAAAAVGGAAARASPRSASLGALEWQRMVGGLSSGRALLWVAVGGGRGGALVLAVRAAAAAAARAAGAAGRGRGGGCWSRLRASRAIDARAASSRATGTSWSTGVGERRCRRSAPCGCRTSAPTRGRGSCSSCSAPSC